MRKVKVIEVDHATEPLSSYAKDVSNDVLVLTSDKEPVAVLIHLGEQGQRIAGAEHQS